MTPADLLSALVVAAAILGLVLLALRAVRLWVDGTDVGRRWGADVEDTYFEGWREEP